MTATDPTPQSFFCRNKLRGSDPLCLQEYDHIIEKARCDESACPKNCQGISDEELDGCLESLRSEWRLGLNNDKDSANYHRLSHYSGAVWLLHEADTILVVAPKIHDLDAVAMFIDIAASPLYSKDVFKDVLNTDSVFGCKPEQPVIEGVDLPDVTLLQVSVFLANLSHFCKRNLRHQFFTTRQNLVGKVKGRIMVGDNVRHNTARGRADRVVCQYAHLTMDTLANRILKAALSRCYRYISQYSKNQQLIIWARQCEAALASVSLENISDNDFRSIHYTGLMKPYRKMHRLARMILKRLRTDARGNVEEHPSSTVPFYLNMWRLFELYVGAQLEKDTKYSFRAQDTLWFSFLSGNAKVGSIGVRPDYYCETNGIVVDAKYKPIGTTHDPDDQMELEPHMSNRFFKDARPSSTDIYQIMAYGDFLGNVKKKDFNIAALMAPGKPATPLPRFRLDDLIDKGAHIVLDYPVKDRKVVVCACPVPSRSQ